MSISMHKGQVMNCPVCGEALSVFEFNGVALDICTRSKCGIWFDVGEVSAVEMSDSLEEIDSVFASDAQPRPRQEQNGDPPRHCPRHGDKLERYEWNLGSGIVLDRCPRDGGIWMDAGEIQHYAAFVKKFHGNATEITPELQARLDKVKDQVEGQFSTALDDVTRSHVPWDAWLLDDMLRGMIKGLMRPFVKP